MRNKLILMQKLVDYNILNIFMSFYWSSILPRGSDI